MDNNLRNTLPSERAELKEKEDAKRAKARKKAEDKLQGHMHRCFKTRDGIEVLRWLYKISGRDKTPLGGSIDGKICPNVTLHNAMKQGIYMEIRKHLDFNILKEVEFND